MRKFRDFLMGRTDEPHEEEIVFANVVLKNHPRKNLVKTEPEEAVPDAPEPILPGSEGLLPPLDTAPDSPNA